MPGRLALEKGPGPPRLPPEDSRARRRRYQSIESPQPWLPWSRLNLGEHTAMCRADCYSGKAAAFRTNAWPASHRQTIANCYNGGTGAPRGLLTVTAVEDCSTDSASQREAAVSAKHHRKHRLSCASNANAPVHDYLNAWQPSSDGQQSPSAAPSATLLLLVVLCSLVRQSKNFGLQLQCTDNSAQLILPQTLLDYFIDCL